MLKNFLFLSISVFNLGNMGASVAMEQQHGRNSYGYPNMGYIQQNFSGNQYQQGYPHGNQVSLSQYNSEAVWKVKFMINQGVNLSKRREFTT